MSLHIKSLANGKKNTANNLTNEQHFSYLTYTCQQIKRTTFCPPAPLLPSPRIALPTAIATFSTPLNVRYLNVAYTVVQVEVNSANNVLAGHKAT